ncbi:MAG TPA: hypothetical protein VD794_10950 [Flavisolibacter sp.]|nr:hypothetical protein [Flavisolibacter sp.]
MTTITVRVIKTQTDYEAVLKRIDEIFDARPGTTQGYELEILLLMVDHYQKKTNPLPKVSPVEVLRFIMEQRGLKQIDIASYMGGKNRISEVMLGKRGLTTRMIKNLSAGLHIPVEALI